MLKPPVRRQAGFTLIELMVTLTLAVLLTLAAIPSFSVWIQNARVRAVAESLQSGLRLAQAEAVRRSRQVVFSQTNAAPNAANVAAATTGRNWALQTVPALAGGTPEFLQGAVTAEIDPDARITGPGTVCFNSMGRLVANATPGTGVACTVDAAQPLQRFLVTRTGADRPLQVTVSLGGQVRLCDPARTLATSPDGCPP